MANANTPFMFDADMPLLITGAAGFIGRNLTARLRAVGYKNLLLYDVASSEGALEQYAKEAAFVFHLAGVNRPKNTSEFYEGNQDLTTRLLSALKNAQNNAPILLTSTLQAGNGTDYAKSKEAAEAAVLAYGEETAVPVFVYRLPGVFGKWSRPGYNTVIATFCHQIARGLPIEVRDAAYSFPVCYIDDVVDSFLARLDPNSPPAPTLKNEDNGFLTVEPVYEVTLGWLSGTIRSFAKTRQTLGLPSMSDALTRKLWATYLSFLPVDDYAYPLQSHVDERGSFTEFLRTSQHGQVSVNITKPGITKGNHWHDSKNEKFLVVKGSAVIRFRAIGSRDVFEYPVHGEEMRVVDIPPGHTHHIENVGNDELVTVMWASEPFDENSPDTYFEPV